MSLRADTLQRVFHNTFVRRFQGPRAWTDFDTRSLVGSLVHDAVIVIEPDLVRAMRDFL